MEIKFTNEENCIYAEFLGELDEYFADYVRSILDEKLGTITNNTKLILDFTYVSFIDSIGIGVILGRYNKINDKTNNIKVEMLIKNPNSHINRIFELTGIYSIIPKVD